MIQRVKRVIVGVVAGMTVLILGTWILIHGLGEHEDRYGGKPLIYWQDRMDSPVPAVSNETRVVIETRVIPRLREQMFNDTRDSKFRLAAIDQLNKLPGVTIYFTPAEGRRAQAAGGLGALGPHAQAAIPDLIQVYKGRDEPVRIAAITALGMMKSQPDTVIPLLISALDDPQDGLAEAAVESLGDFGARSRAAWPKLVPLLKLRDKDMQRALKIALKQIDPDEAAKLGMK